MLEYLFANKNVEKVRNPVPRVNILYNICNAFMEEYKACEKPGQVPICTIWIELMQIKLLSLRSIVAKILKMDHFGPIKIYG